MSLTLSIANAPVKAADHDLCPEAKQIPLGIQEVGRLGALGIEWEASELDTTSTRRGSSPVRSTEGLLAPGPVKLLPGATWVSVAGMRDLAAQVPREGEVSPAAKSDIPAKLTQEWVCW